MRRRLTRSAPRPNPLAVLAVAAVATVALAGCSGESDKEEPLTDETDSAEVSADPAQVLQDAVSKTIELQAFTIDSDLSLQISSQDLRLETRGSIDYGTTVGDIMLKVSQADAGGSARVLSDGETLWVSLEGEQAPSIPGGVTWLQGETSRLAESTTFTPGGLLGAVLVLRGAEDVEVVGTDEIDEVSVTRYATTFTYADATAAVSGDEAETLKGTFSLTGDAAALELEVEVAVGEDGVLREVGLDLVAQDSVPASGGYDLELTDVGKEIEAPEPPDPADVATGPEAQALLDQIIT